MSAAEHVHAVPGFEQNCKGVQGSPKLFTQFFTQAPGLCRYLIQLRTNLIHNQRHNIMERRRVLARLANWLFAFGLASFLPLKGAIAKDKKQNQGAGMKLPQPKMEGSISVERAIRQRRTIRNYSSRILQVDQLAQLL
jgi:hypothetical protein